MFALVFAVVSLSGLDPDPIVTPVPALHDRLLGADGFAPGSVAGSAPSTGLEVSACTFGAPQLGSDWWTGANALARALALPSCSTDGLSRSLVPGYRPALGFVSPWPATSPRFAPAPAPPVRLQFVRPDLRVGTVPYAPATVPVRFLTRAGPDMREPVSLPLVPRTRFVPVATPERRRR